jgi:hypothetical protein
VPFSPLDKIFFAFSGDAMFHLMMIFLLTLTPTIFAKRSSHKNPVLAQASLPNIPGMTTPGMMPTTEMQIPTPLNSTPIEQPVAAPATSQPATPAIPQAPQPPVPIVAPAESVVPPVVPAPTPAPTPAPVKEEKPNELKLILDRLASLEQKMTVLESKLAVSEQKLSKVESQLTAFINEIAAPTPEDEEEEANTPNDNNTPESADTEDTNDMPESL